MRVAVVGASGVIGGALVPVLAQTHEVVALSRRPAAADAVNVRRVAADALDAHRLPAALDGAEVVYHLLHSLGSPDFEERDRRAAANVAAAAAAAGARQIVFLGGLGSGELSPHLRSRRETAEVLASGPVPVTSIAVAMVIGRGSAAFETILALVDRLPVMVCPRWVSTPTQPIALDDVVAYLAGVCGLGAAIGQRFDAGGPDVMTYREMIERIARLRGRRPLLVEVPVLSPRLSSLWLHLVTPVRSSVARPLVEGLRTPTLAADTRLRRLVPRELTRFDDAARAALAAGV
jgi:uncharacterized protein YbjT (DUF2867 family)